MTVSIESIKETFKERARAGKAFLEENYPGFQIDTSRLDIGNEYNCALAQASGQEYWPAVWEKGLSFEDEKNLGFFPHVEDGWKYHEVDICNLLTEAWKEVLDSN